ncbi:MAG: DedA family protein [Chloroflexi bacterium]|nr:DedA family protein [Chloroflexota bacterium]
MNGDLPFGFQQTWQVVLAWLTHHESLLIFLAIFVEESGIPMPLPADAAMALAGYRVAQGRMSLLEAFLIGQVATLAGSSVLYWVGRRGGRPLLFRYGRLMRLNAHRLAQLERLVTRLGPYAIIIGRQIPGLRLAAPLACGVFRIPYRLFVPAMIVGSSVYIGIFLVLGMWGGPAVYNIVRVSGLPIRFLLTSVLLVVASVFLYRLSRSAREVVAPAYRLAASRRRSLEAALLAGLGASALMALVVTWTLELLGLIAQSPPERALVRVLEVGTTLPGTAGPGAGIGPHRLILAGLTASIPFQVAALLVWAIVYAFVFEPRLRGRAGMRGLKFALVPWLVSGLVMFPLLEAGIFGIGLGGGLFPAAGELARHVVFGIALGALYRLIRIARQPRGHEGYRHGHRHPVGALPDHDGRTDYAALAGVHVTDVRGRGSPSPLAPLPPGERGTTDSPLPASAWERGRG